MEVNRGAQAAWKEAATTNHNQMEVIPAVEKEGKLQKRNARLQQ